MQVLVQFWKVVMGEGGYLQNWVGDHFLDLHCCTITVELKVFRNKKKIRLECADSIAS